MGYPRPAKQSSSPARGPDQAGTISTGALGTNTAISTEQRKGDHGFNSLTKHRYLCTIYIPPKELDLNLDGDRARKVPLALSYLFF